MTIALAAVVTSGALVACGAVTQHTTVSRTPSRGDRAEFDFVADTGTQTADSMAITAAEGRLTARCMARAGFRYYPGIGPKESSVYRAITLYSYSGAPPEQSADIAARERYGYGLFSTFTPAGELADDGGRPAVADREYLAGLAPSVKAAYYRALQGPLRTPQRSVTVEGIETSYDPAGCPGQADSALFGSMRRMVEIVDVGEAAFERVTALTAKAPSVRQALRAWSSCLHAVSGRNFANANVPIEYLQSLYARDGATRALHSLERKLSAQDGRCQFSSGLARAYSSAFADNFRTLGPRFIAQIRRAIVTDRAAARRARRLLSSIPAPAEPPPSNGQAIGTKATQSLKPIQIGSPRAQERQGSSRSTPVRP